MVDPITGAVVAKAMGDTSPEMQQATTNLFLRIFGPSADAIGEALGRYTTYRLRNIGRIVNRADAKSNDMPDRGIANPRVSHVLLEEGSYCDSDIMVDYLGGVLAASRTPAGRDDRAVAWSNLVTSLSSLQIRAHYLLYREWAERLHGIQDLNLGVDQGGLCKTPVITSGRNAVRNCAEVWRHAIPGNRQRLLRTIERRFPTPNLSRRRSRCDSIVCQDWTLSNLTSWNIA